MSEELKSCPFCGAKAEFSDLSYLTGKPSWCISCTSSKCFAPHTDTCSKKEAVERWNNRPAEEAKTARIAELEREIKFLKTEMTCWDSYIKELEKKVSGNE